jgi:hypothetical protein
MHKLLTAGLAVALIVSGSAAEAKKKKPNAAPIPIDRPSTATPVPLSKSERRGLNDVLGKGIADLKRMFGEPRIDVIEVYGRKLQFSGKACILDAYLYPDGRDGAEIVTHVDARRSDGAEVDRAACVDALIRR